MTKTLTELTLQMNASKLNYAAIALAMLASSAPVVSLADSTGVALEEILVTAQKRVESLQETPISMQAFSGLELESRTAGDISNIADFTPNMEFDTTSPISGSSNAAVVFIRGIGQTDFVLTSDPGVGIYLDGVYISRAMGGVLDLLDIERVEVLRGPQGTLFGKNTVGGAISVITKKPGPEFELEASVTAGNDDRLDGMLSANIPIIEDSLFLRASLATRNRDGYGDRVLTGESMGDVNSDTVRGSLLWLPREDLELTLSADYTTLNEDLPTSSLIVADPTLGDRNLSSLYNLYATVGWLDGPLYNDSWLTGDQNKSNGTAPVGSEADVWGTALTAVWDLPGFSVKSISAYRKSEPSFGRDTDHSPIIILHTSNEMDTDQFSQEFNISGHAFDDRLDWLVGAYYFSEDGKDHPRISILPAVYAADQEQVNGAGNGNGYLGDPLPEFSVHGDIETNNSSVALFLHNSYMITDKLSTTFGLRYTDEEKKTLLDVYYPTTGEKFLPDPNSKETFDDWSPLFGLEYRWSDDLFTYASYSEGFKSGGVVSRYIQPREEPIVFEPEEVKNYEIGVKSEWLDQRLRLNAAAFYMDYTDIQVTVFNNVVPETRNAAEADVYGAELELTALLTEGLLLTGAAGYIDASYNNLDDPIDGELEITEDDWFVNTPEWTASLSLEYLFQLAKLGEMTLRLDYSYRDEVANDAANTPELIEDSLTLWNARVSLLSNDEKWDIAIFGRNLTDEDYLISGVSTPGFGIVEGVYARPREYGLTLKYKL